MDARWPNFTNMRDLHTRAKVKPINQILHTRAKNLWIKIENGTAGDPTRFTSIRDMPFESPNNYFPSSYRRTLKEEPPPLYTERDSHSPDILLYYNTN